MITIRNRSKSVWRNEKYSLLKSGLCRCSKCLVVKELNDDNFSKRKDNKTGFSSWCRVCQRNHAKENMNKRRADPLESIVVKEEKNRHSKSVSGIEGKRLRDKVRNHKKRSNVFIWTVQNWNECKAYFKNRCAYCDAEADLTQDHFIALNDSTCPGTIVLNMIPACNSCNCSKKDTSPYVWCTAEALIKVEQYFSFIKNRFAL